MTDLDLTAARENMLEQQLRTWEVLNNDILETLESLPREHFAPAAYRNLAYADMQIPIGHGEVMLEPKVEGRLLQAVDPQAEDRVLEIGTGTGYLTACLARMAGHVTSIDLYPEFIDTAKAHLDREAIKNVRLEAGDAATGWNDGNHYDVIIVTGSLPELHHGFHQRLSDGGRLFLITGQAPIMEALLITRVGDNQYATESLFDTFAPALVGAPITQHFSL